MSKEPFYNRVYMLKVSGGKQTLWHAGFLTSDKKTLPALHSWLGAGNTAENAIKHLADLERRYLRRLASKAK